MNKIHKKIQLNVQAKKTDYQKLQHNLHLKINSKLQSKIKLNDSYCIVTELYYSHIINCQKKYYKLFLRKNILKYYTSFVHQIVLFKNQ